MHSDPFGFLGDELSRKEEVTMDRLRHFEPAGGYSLAFSGGKDSVVLLDIAKRSGVQFEARYAVTTIDPPELVHFIRRYHPGVKWDHPDVPFLRYMVRVKKFPPMRNKRWCCAKYKERWGAGTVLTGVRWAESARRRNTRQMLEHCMAGGTAKHNRKMLMHPIIDWSDEEVWGYIAKYSLPYCSLYDEGRRRIGCLFCPMAYYKRRLEDAERWPRITRIWIKAFEELYTIRKSEGLSVVNWASGEDAFWWWLAYEDRSAAETVRQGIWQED